MAEMHHRLKFNENWSICCGESEFLIFQNGGRLHQLIFKFLEDQDASLCHILSKSFKRFLRYRIY